MLLGVGVLSTAPCAGLTLELAPCSPLCSSSSTSGCITLCQTPSVSACLQVQPKQLLEIIRNLLCFALFLSPFVPCTQPEYLSNTGWGLFCFTPTCLKGCQCLFPFEILIQTAKLNFYGVNPPEKSPSPF